MCKASNEAFYRLYIVPRQWALANQDTEIAMPLRLLITEVAANEDAAPLD